MALAATPSNVLDDYMFHFRLHSWKWEYDPLHHNKNTSQQNMQMMIILPNLKVSVD